MVTVSKFFKEENDFLYKRGIQKGKEEKDRQIVEKLIVKLGFSDEQAADFAAVSIEYVAKLRAELQRQ